MMKRNISTLFLFVSICVYSQNISVTTQRYDNSRLGWNGNEQILNTSNVNSGTFGLLFSRAVDDQVYAQPLLLANLTIGGGQHNVLFIATVNNSVCAYDADDPAQSTPFWKVNLTPSGTRVITNADFSAAGACDGNYKDFSGNIGIVGTPVINTANSTLYVVTRDYNTTTNKFEQFFHALDIITGQDRSGSPVAITATYSGTGTGSVNGTITFDPESQNQRPALMLLNNIVYICWASHCDWGPYHGWVIGYDATTLQQKIVYNVTPDGYYGGLWMSGAGPSVDDKGNIYISTGNGTVGANGDANNIRNRGESLLKLQPYGNTLRVVNFFTPNNYSYLEAHDVDFGTSAPIIIPNTTLVLSGTKEGKLFFLNTSHLGRYSAKNDSVIQVLYTNPQTTSDVHIHGTPVYCHLGGPDAENVYVWAESDSLKQFSFDRSSGLFDLKKTITGTKRLDYGMPGSMLLASSYGNNGGTGIIWASHPQSGDANHSVRPGTLEAYDATDIRKLLWNSDQVSSRDAVGNFAKFNNPVVANGKVYLATFSNKVDVYGLLKPVNSPVPAPWVTGDVGSVATPGNASYATGTFTINGAGADIWGSSDQYRFVYQPLAGNGNIVARIVSLNNTNNWAKAGVMIRESLNAGSTYAMSDIAAAKGLYSQNRTTTNGTSASTTGMGGTFPYWLKVERTDNIFNSYVSSNGTSWTLVGTTTISMGTNVFIGMAVTSHAPGSLTQALFDNVTVTGTTPPVITNVALKKPATASSVESGTTLVATNSNDGSTSTRWSSLFSDPQWLTIDLQGIYNISQIILKWETASGKNYTLDVSNDNTTWTTVKTVTNGTGGTETWNLSGVSGRYLRMYGTARNTAWGYSLWEIEAYGSLKSAIAPDTSSLIATGKVIVYPNPFRDNITINLDESAGYRNASIYDVFGTVKTQWEIFPEETSLNKDLSALPSGIYILELKGNARKETMRIIKQ